MRSLLVLFWASIVVSRKVPPHIIFVLVDDLGWDDVSFHGSSQIPTPNIDTLAADGIILNNYYVQPMCTPSRSALMTGMYPIHTGMQHWVIRSPEPWGLPLELKIMPQYLKELGYATHLVGKWHLGYFQKEYTPIYRGFDSFYGYYNGFIDYYHHRNQYKRHVGLDFRMNMAPTQKGSGRYATDLFADHVISLVESHNKSQPLFLYLSHLAPHAATEKEPLQAPDENVRKFTYIGDGNRTMFAAMVDKLDESIGRLTEALQRADMLENAIIVFSSDNGALPYGTHSNSGFNWPLRGTKMSLWEGGVRVPAFIWSPLLQKRRRVSRQLMHITDWLPTLYAAAGGTPSNLGYVDGYNMWEALSRGWRSPRKEVLLNIDPVTGSGALRYGKHKIVYDVPVRGSSDVHLKTPGQPRPTSQADEELDWLMENSLAAKALRMFYNTNRLPPRPNWRKDATVQCGVLAYRSNFVSQQPPYLFDLEIDPCEMFNLADIRRRTMGTMVRMLQSFEQSMIPHRNQPEDPGSYPEKHGGIWTTWKRSPQ